MIWIKNTDGKPSATLTMLWLSFLVCVFSALTATLQEVNVGGFDIKFNEFDVGFSSTVFLGLAALYYGRRATDRKAIQETQAQAFQYGASMAAASKGAIMGGVVSTIVSDVAGSPSASNTKGQSDEV